MAKLEFIKCYLERSEIITEVQKYDFFNRVVAVECNCGEDGCQGWQMKSINVTELENKHKNKNT